MSNSSVVNSSETCSTCCIVVVVTILRCSLSRTHWLQYGLCHLLCVLLWLQNGWFLENGGGRLWGRQLAPQLGARLPRKWLALMKALAWRWHEGGASLGGKGLDCHNLRQSHLVTLKLWLLSRYYYNLLYVSICILCIISTLQISTEFLDRKSELYEGTNRTPHTQSKF